MKPPSRRSTRPNRKAAARQSPEYKAALAEREASGRMRKPQPRKPRAIDTPLTLGPEEVAWVRSMLIHEDASVMGFNKPPNLSSQGGRGHFHNLDDLLWAFARSGGKKPRLVHRLDRDTSGIIVAARTKPAAAFLGNAIAARQVDKTYLCIVTHPENLGSEGQVDVPLRREEIGREAWSRVCDASHPDALSARTNWRVLKRNADAALVLCKPHTGRMHQIRVHMAHLGSPIAGDARYGGALSVAGVGIRRLMLHARAFAFPHPDGGRMQLEAPLSPDMERVAIDLGLLETADKN